MQHRRGDLAGLIFESQIIAEAFNRRFAVQSKFFLKLNRGGIEIGFGEIAIDLIQAGFWIISGLPTTRGLSRYGTGERPVRVSRVGLQHGSIMQGTAQSPV